MAREVVVRLLVALACVWAAPAWANCKLVVQAELPVTMIDGEPVITARINGVEARLELHSYSFFSVLPTQAAAKFALERKAAPADLSVRQGGKQVDPKVGRAAHFELAGLDIDNADFLLTDGFGDNFRLDGLLGQNILSSFDVEYDLARNVVRLFRPEGCERVMLAYWTKADYSEVFLDHMEPGQWFTGFQVKLNGRELRARLTTTNSQTQVSLAAAALAGVTPGGPGVSPAASPSSGDAPKTWSAPFDRLVVGREEFRGVPLSIDNQRSAPPVLWLGLDFLLTHRVFVANSQEKMYFTPNPGAVFGAEPPASPVGPAKP
jgi:predicted aspartyl protease